MHQQSPCLVRPRTLDVLLYAVTERKDPSRVAAGLEATLHNPKVSVEAKNDAQKRLNTEVDMGVSSGTRSAYYSQAFSLN